MKYKVRLSISEADKKDYKSRGRWPLLINDTPFDESTEIVAEDLMPFVANKKHPYMGKELRLDPRLTFETLNEDSETTD